MLLFALGVNIQYKRAASYFVPQGCPPHLRHRHISARGQARRYRLFDNSAIPLIRDARLDTSHRIVTTIPIAGPSRGLWVQV